MLKLLHTAYSTISVADAAGFLGMTENEVVNCKYLQHFSDLKLEKGSPLYSWDCALCGATVREHAVLAFPDKKLWGPVLCMPCHSE